MLFAPPYARPMAWVKWKEVREKYGIVALEWARDAVLMHTGGGFGGESWARLVENVRLFRTGQMSATMYVDVCWGTQHNGGQFFNKLWGLGTLKAVLDANLAGKLEQLKGWATTDVAILHTQKRTLNLEGK